MQPVEIRDLYDDAYAASYEAKFLRSAMTAADADYELELLKTLLTPGSKWLDVACGTGYFLRHFPEVERTGLDLSPAMLRKAREGNADIELVEHDFRAEIPAWTGRFDLVTLMWYAYGLVDTVGDLARVARNLANWTSPSGTCFVPLADPALITGVALPYVRQDSGFPGVVSVTGILWSYSEDDGTKVHRHQIAPHVDFMVELFEQHFTSVKLVRYPPAFPGWAGRPALVATGKAA